MNNMPPAPFSGHTSSGPHSVAADAPNARLDARRLRSLIVISFSASVAFTAMYSTQPILPQISQEFHVSPAEAGLTLLAVTFALAVASLGAGRMADAIARRQQRLDDLIYRLSTAQRALLGQRRRRLDMASAGVRHHDLRRVLTGVRRD